MACMHDSLLGICKVNTAAMRHKATQAGVVESLSPNPDSKHNPKPTSSPARRGHPAAPVG